MGRGVRISGSAGGLRGGGDVLPRAALADEHLGQGGTLLAGEQPADHGAAEDVEQHVERST